MALTLLYVAQGGGDPISGLLIPMVLIFGIFYFLLIRPQGKQRQEREKMLSLLKRDDQVITVGGLYGRIRSIQDNVVTLEIADRVNIRIRLTSIESRAPEANTSKDTSKDTPKDTSKESDSSETAPSDLKKSE